MSKKLVYVKKFRPKSDIAIELERGRVYEAIDEGGFFNILVDPSQQFLVDKKVQDGPRFEADIVELSGDNFSGFEYDRRDTELISKYFIRPKIEQAAQKLAKAEEDAIVRANSYLNTILLTDLEMFGALGEVFNHIADTPPEGWSDITTENLSRRSPVSAGYNLGNAVDHIKRYLGARRQKPEDLLLAIKFLLFELISFKNIRSGPTENTVL